MSFHVENHQTREIVCSHIEDLSDAVQEARRRARLSSERWRVVEHKDGMAWSVYSTPVKGWVKT